MNLRYNGLNRSALVEIVHSGSLPVQPGRSAGMSTSNSTEKLNLTRFFINLTEVGFIIYEFGEQAKLI